ncbi:hypothetical protein C0991_006133, partial [Blastosporella zonata]
MSNPALYIMAVEDQFSGNNWSKFKTKLISATRGCGLKGYLDSTLPRPSPTPTTPATTTTWWGSLTPMSKEWDQQDAFAMSMVALNVEISGLGLVNAEAVLASIRYTEGNDLEVHFTAMCTAWGNANDQGTDISDAKFRIFIIKSLPRTAKWAVLASALMTIEASAKIIHHITMHGPQVGANTAPVANAAIANITASKQVQSMAFSAATGIAPPITNQRITYADSAASRHFFTDCANFITYETAPPGIADGLVANGGVFRVEGIGRVRKMVEIEGRKIELTLDNALYAPHLNHNLISIGCLDKKGCTVMFGGARPLSTNPTDPPLCTAGTIRGPCHISHVCMVKLKACTSRDLAQMPGT